ncbi:hypothetical protein [Hyalangium rubrum]|uniref:XRE family transcriptional regulator n=1 Tax=Hyalangium rubrum TaxID=3103134 RepID=A0ABU5HLQ5_9BACT|nr:hypothetical protein [Hyalangium sp. s54d21]MDY7233035.1 hypothetical protein [Hyalangium sp. s54d21]
MDDFRKYEAMRDNGASPSDVYYHARTDGIDSVSMIRMLRKIFNLSLLEAKEITVGTSSQTTPSLNESQEKLAPALEKALKKYDDEAQ